MLTDMASHQGLHGVVLAVAALGTVAGTAVPGHRRCEPKQCSSDARPDHQTPLKAGKIQVHYALGPSPLLRWRVPQSREPSAGHAAALRSASAFLDAAVLDRLHSCRCDHPMVWVPQETSLTGSSAVGAAIADLPTGLGVEANRKVDLSGRIPSKQFRPITRLTCAEQGQNRGKLMLLTLLSLITAAGLVLWQLVRNLVASDQSNNDHFQNHRYVPHVPRVAQCQWPRLAIHLTARINTHQQKLPGGPRERCGRADQLGSDVDVRQVLQPWNFFESYPRMTRRKLIASHSVSSAFLDTCSSASWFDQT